MLWLGSARRMPRTGVPPDGVASSDPIVSAARPKAVSAARQILSLYDTGAWSLYYRTRSGPGHESDLSYHELFGSFLDEMCQRWQAPFCDMAANFHRYETEPVTLSSLRAKVDRRKKQMRVGFAISKRSGITLSARRGTKTVYNFVSPLERGPHRVVWPLPKRGRYTIVLSAKSLNGLTSQTSVAVSVPHS